MQAGFITSRTPSPTERETPTRVDIYPPPPTETQASAKPTGFFSEEGPSFRDVLDAINPLNHIPIVSSLFEEAAGHQASTAARLAGGTLLGGPIGFIASLASVIFESETGASPAETLYAAVTGDSLAGAPTQVAQAEPAPDSAATQTAQAAPVTPVSSDAALALASLDQQTQAALSTSSHIHAARTTTDVARASGDDAVLSLYGNSANSAHASYRKAQLLPYLKDVNSSRVL
jgi:hypothetical protein